MGARLLESTSESPDQLGMTDLCTSIKETGHVLTGYNELLAAELIDY